MSEHQVTTDEVRALETLDLAGLRAEWARRYGAPPSLRSVPILRMLLAWRIQSQALGGIDGTTRRTLARKGQVQAEGLGLGIGARLTRQWQGREHEVIVEADGFRWKGKTFKRCCQSDRNSSPIDAAIAAAA